MKKYLAIIILFFCIFQSFAQNLSWNIPTVDSLPVFHNYAEIERVTSIDKSLDFEIIIKNLRQVQNNVLTNCNGKDIYIPICIYKCHGLRFLLYEQSDYYSCLIKLASLDSGSEFPPVLCIFTYNFDKSLQYKLSADNIITIETCTEEGNIRIPYKSSVYKLDKDFTKVR